MSLDAIKTQLVVQENTVSGIKLVYANRPDVDPTEADMPCIINDYAKPFLQVFSPMNGQCGYAWRFQVKFLWSALGLGQPSEWDANIEPYPARLVAALFATLTLTGAAFNLELGDFDGFVPVVYGSSVYYGFSVPVTVREFVTTTIAA